MTISAGAECRPPSDFTGFVSCREVAGDSATRGACCRAVLSRDRTTRVSVQKLSARVSDGMFRFDQTGARSERNNGRGFPPDTQTCPGSLSSSSLTRRISALEDVWVYEFPTILRQFVIPKTWNRAGNAGKGQTVSVPGCANSLGTPLVGIARDKFSPRGKSPPASSSCAAGRTAH